MTSVQTENKIIWAIDPFEDSSKTKNHLLETLEQISKKQNILIEPIHILSFSTENDKNFKESQHHFNQYKHAAEKATEQTIRDIQGIKLIRPHILMVENASTLEMVRELNQYAVQNYAKAIVVGTHARHGLPRIFFGSFAEALVLHSQIPVITVSPECRDYLNRGRILFPTDLSKKATETYHKVLQLARDLQSDVTLFHVISHRIESVIQTGTYLLSGGWATMPEHLSKEEYEKQKLAGEWAEEAKKAGIEVNIHFELTRGNIADLILDYANQSNFAWIAMAAKSGVVKTAVIGSIIQQVIRRSPCPLWIHALKATH
jgi:nucleotide-binding universal stress UspA family protein